MPDIMKMGKNPNYLGSGDLDELPGRELTSASERYGAISLFARSQSRG